MSLAKLVSFGISFSGLTKHMLSEYRIGVLREGKKTLIVIQVKVTVRVKLIVRKNMLINRLEHYNLV